MAKTRISKEEWRKITARLFVNMTPQERDRFEQAHSELTQARQDTGHFSRLIR